MTMTVFGGLNTEASIDAEVVDRGAGAGEMVCQDCDGSGQFPEPDGTPAPCTPCKGTGRVLVSV